MSKFTIKLSTSTCKQNPDIEELKSLRKEIDKLYLNAKTHIPRSAIIMHALAPFFSLKESQD
jgi:hypothetical protein